MTRDLLAGADIARLIGVSRQRAHVLAKSPGFPTPAVETSLGKFWRRADVEKFLATWPRRDGRPPQKVELGDLADAAQAIERAVGRRRRNAPRDST